MAVSVDQKRLSRKIGVDLKALVDTTKSLSEGAVIAPGLAGWERDLYIRSCLFENDKKLADYAAEEWGLLLNSEPRKYKLAIGSPGNVYEGLVVKFNRKFISRDIQTLSERTRQKIESFLRRGPCLLCKGARLNQAALSCNINGYNIAKLAEIEVDEPVR